MFISVWRQVISAIAYAFTTFDDEYTVQRAISGLRECATLAGCFELPEIIDFIVISLSQSSGLIPESLVTSVPPYPVVKVEEQDVTISTLAVNFGTNFKGQLASVVLFTIANGNGDAIREGWTYVRGVYFVGCLITERYLCSCRFLRYSRISSCTPFFQLACCKWKNS